MQANEFSDLIFSTRQGVHRSARAFWKENQSKLEISYERYAKVEKGEIPSLQAAIRIISALEIDESKGLHTWMRASLPTPKLKSYFTQEKDDFYAENRIVLSLNQKALIENYPIIYKVVTYLSMYADKYEITPKTLSKDLNIPLAEVHSIIRKLKSANLINLRSKNIQFKEWFFVPDDIEYRRLRRQNFRGFVNSQLEADFNELYSFERVTVRLVKPDLLNELKEKMHALSQWFINAKEPSDTGIPYIIYVGGGKVDFTKGNKFWTSN